MITLTHTGTKVTLRFKTARDAGAYLEAINWPPGLLYAPRPDRVGLARVMVASPFEVCDSAEGGR